MLITINDKQVKLRFGMHVAEYLEEILNIQSGSVLISAILILRAYENYLLVNRSEVVELTREEIYEWIEDGTIAGDKAVTSTVAAVWKAFNESPLIKSALQKIEEAVSDAEAQAAKKKAPGKK